MMVSAPAEAGSCAPLCAVALVLAVLGTALPAHAQLSAPNSAGVAMGHLHYRVRDVAANTRFWVALGAQPVDARAIGGDDSKPREGRDLDADRANRAVTVQVLKLPDVLVFLEQGESSGGTEGSIVNHVAFRVPSLTAVEKAGLTVARLQGFPGVASVMTPEGERVELFENAATNLTFTYDNGQSNPVSERHNRPLTLPIAFHHIHLYLPDGAVAEAKAWYVRMFGGIPGKRSNYDAVDLPGINLNLSVGPRPTVPTAGRMLDHIGFEVTGLAAFCTRLEGMGVTFQSRYSRDASGYGTAILVDPWGTRIELTEGLRRY